jgi:hypothetical protein
VILFIRGIKNKIASLKLFNKINERQKTLSSYKGKKSSEESKIAYVLGLCKVATAALLAVLLVVTVLFGSGVISYEKVYYMFKDISYIKTFDEGASSSLNYSRPVQNQVFENFKNGLLVASDSELKMFTSTGRVTLTEGTEMINPRVATSSGYTLIYDQGRKAYSVYNSFVKLYSERTEYPIALADISDNGELLVVTSSAKYTSVVKIYGSDFKQRGEFLKNDRVISAAISSDGKYASIVSLDASDGTGHVKISVVDCKKNAIISETVFSGSMPYFCEFLNNDRIALVLDDKALVISRAGRVIGEYEYTASVERIDVHGDRFAILLSEAEGQDKKQISVFDSGCTKVFSSSTSGSVRDLELGDGYVYLLKSREAIRISTLLGTQVSREVYVDTTRLVALDDGRVIACSAASGSYISFD